MRCPFPGMDPYLEHPALWPDVHSRLINAISDAVTPMVAGRYFVGIEQRTYRLTAGDAVLIGRPDVGFATRSPAPPEGSEAPDQANPAAVLDVAVPMAEDVADTYLEVRETRTGRLATVIEVLSPTNKLRTQGRRQYLKKRNKVLSTRTSLIEIDLIRVGEPMTTIGPEVESDYRLLIARGWSRPRAKLYPFSLRGPIPTFPLPLLRGDVEPEVDLNKVFHALYTRARYDLRVDYAAEAVPPLPGPDAAWARETLGG